ncbi:MAG: hypothetical protein ACRDVW_06210 [Acidimicrobiales bacterium]
MAETMTALLEEGQRREEVSYHYPARAVAQSALSAICGAHYHEVEYQHPPKEKATPWRALRHRCAALTVPMAAVCRTSTLGRTGDVLLFGHRGNVAGLVHHPMGKNRHDFASPVLLAAR